MKRWTNIFLNWLMWGIAIFLLLKTGYVVARILCGDQFVIPTDSMQPTLLPGDRVMVHKPILGARIYTDFDFDPNGTELHALRLKGMREIRHNDIVVFNYPQNGGRLAFVINYVYCKRVVALPGDTLSIVNGFYRSNNFPNVLGLENQQRMLEALEGKPEGFEGWTVGPWQLGWTVQEAGPWYVPRAGDVIDIGYKEGLLYGDLLAYETGKTIELNDSLQQVLCDGEPMIWHQFKHNYYFMAGDNVLNSRDSRYFGLVPEDYIVGVASYISYSEDRNSGCIRWQRILSGL